MGGSCLLLQSQVQVKQQLDLQEVGDHLRKLTGGEGLAATGPPAP